jgi:hypothetical protein
MNNKTAENKFQSINLGALIVSFMLAFMGADIAVTPIVVIGFFVQIFLPKISAIMPIFLIGAFIFYIVSLIIIFKKAYKYFCSSFNENYKPTPKWVMLFALLMIFGVVLTVILVEATEKLTK